MLTMLTDKVQNLHRSYNLLDYIAKVVRDSELEQLAQAAQMRRIDERLDSIEVRMAALEGRINKLEKRMDRFEQHMEKIENDIGDMKKILVIITKHLGIAQA